MLDENDGIPVADEFQPPEWLQRTLAAGGTSPEFQRRSEDAALVALSIVKLRRQRDQLGFVPIPFARYLAGLARLAGVALDSVLAFYQVTASPKWEQLVSWTQIAQDLGVPSRQAAALLKIWRIEESDLAPFPMMVAARRSPAAPSDPLLECEQTLEAAASSGAPALVDEFKTVDEAVRRAYQQQH